jgi:hypothetical protein
VTPEQRRARAYLAQSLMRDDVMQQAWAELENELREEWERSFLPRKRDRIWNELRHVRRLRQKLASFAGHARD